MLQIITDINDIVDIVIDNDRVGVYTDILRILLHMYRYLTNNVTDFLCGENTYYILNINLNKEKNYDLLIPSFLTLAIRKKYIV